MSEETVRGIVRNVRLSTEQGRNISVELAKNYGWSSVRVHKTRQTWSFIARDYGKSPYNHPLLAVAMAGKRTRGVVREGDEIIAISYLNKDNVFIAKKIESLLTGENYIAVGSSGILKLGIIFLLLLSIFAIFYT